MSNSKFSFGRLLRNDRLMIVLSLILAMGLWYYVMSGSANIRQRTITCTLTTDNVSNGNLQVIESQAIPVKVVVEGALSDITALAEDDIRVQLNASDIQTAGTCRIHVLASRNSQANDYTIVSTSPSIVSLFCDEWAEGREYSIDAGTVLAEAASVTAEGDSRDIGSVSISPDALPGGVLSVQGPLSVVNRIHHFAARVPDAVNITEQSTFVGNLVAFDKNGHEVDLTHCTLMRYDSDPAANENAALVNMTENTLNVSVTVNERREVTFTYTVQNAPAGVDLSKIVTIDPATVTLEGEKELLEQYVEQLRLLTTIDFDTLSTKETSRVIPITLPEGVTVVGSGAGELSVTLRFNWSNYTTRTITWNIGTDVTASPITFNNLPQDKSVKLLTNSLSVTVFGERAAVNALKPEDLRATVDVSNSSLGTYSVRPTVGSDKVWVYYGGNGYTVYLSIE